MRRGGNLLPGLAVCAVLFLGLACAPPVYAQGAAGNATRKAGKSLRAAPVKRTSGSIVPKAHGGTVNVLVGTKGSRYYKATKVKPVELSVRGPKTVRILSRYFFAAPAAGSGAAYTVRLHLDGKGVKTLKAVAVASKKATAADGGKIGVLRQALVQVPVGVHKIRVFPGEEGVTLVVRALAGTRKKTSLKWTPFAPETYDRVLRMHVKDNESATYHLTTVKPVGVSVHGPLKMRVSTRLDFGSVHGTTQAYVIRILLDGQPWKGFQLNSRASHTAIYPEMGEVTPGVARQFECEIPTGTHQVDFTLDGTTAPGATLQIQVPTKALRVAAEGS